MPDNGDGKRTIEEHRKRVVDTVTKAVAIGANPSPEQLQGTLKGLLSVAAVVYLKLHGIPVTRRLVDAAGAAAANAIRQRVESDGID